MSSPDVPQGPKPISEECVLVGEGREEVLFFEALLAHIQVCGIQVEECKGKEGLTLYLRTLKLRTGFTRLRRLGIIRDADENPAGALLSVENAITQAALPLQLTVTKLILPGSDRRGALEDLCLQTISGQEIEQCIETFMECATKATGIRHQSTSNRAKARVHAWLASQVRPDLRLGHAAAKGFLNWQAPAFAELIDFLKALS